MTLSECIALTASAIPGILGEKSPEGLSSASPSTRRTSFGLGVQADRAVSEQRGLSGRLLDNEIKNCLLIAELFNTGS